jgi:hypothetical protein
MRQAAASVDPRPLVTRPYLSIFYQGRASRNRVMWGQMARGFEVPELSSPLQELQMGGTSAHFPKFVLHRSTHFHELRKVMGYSQTY